MLKINWKVRFKNKAFIISFVTIVLSFVYQILGLFEIVAPISKEQVTQIIMIVINLLAGLGVLVDPTTAGIKDSDRAMSYK